MDCCQSQNDALATVRAEIAQLETEANPMRIAANSKRAHLVDTIKRFHDREQSFNLEAEQLERRRLLLEVRVRVYTLAHAPEYIGCGTYAHLLFS